MIRKLICRFIGHKLRIKFDTTKGRYMDQYYISMCKRCKALLELKLNYDMTYGNLYVTIEQVLRRE